MSEPDHLMRISDHVSEVAASNPDGAALALGSWRMSYRELADSIDQVAKALIAAGVRKGDRVATLQTPRPEFMVCFLATASIGAIWLGLNPKYRLEELRHCVSDAEPRVLIARTEIEGRSYREELAALMDLPSLERLVVFDGDPLVEDAVTLSEFIVEGHGVPAAQLAEMRSSCGGRDPCLIVYTSGSTGKPKGALLHHEGISAFSLEQNRLWPVQTYRALNFLPINHVGCLVDISMPILAAGGELHFMEHFDVAESLAIMSREKITLWLSVPSVFALQLEHPSFTEFDLSHLELIVWEGAAMAEEMIRRMLAIKPRLATNYGMTETTSAITALEPTSDVELLANTVGSAFSGVEVRIADEDGREAPDGEQGEIQARSRYNLLGYWRNPEATAAAFTADGFFRTGDLGVRRSDGRYKIVGRLKEMFKSGGYNVYPREVEDAIEAHPSVALAAVVSLPDPLWSEVGVAYVMPRTGHVLEPDQLQAWCRERLANYKIPKRFMISSELPLLPIGKVDKQALRTAALAAG